MTKLEEITLKIAKVALIFSAAAIYFLFFRAFMHVPFYNYGIQTESSGLNRMERLLEKR